MAKEYTHRFKCWATAINKIPAEALDRDEEGTPLNLYAFSLWIQERWSEWLKLNGRSRDNPLWDEDHKQFDTWLAQRVGLTTA